MGTKSKVALGILAVLGLCVGAAVVWWQRNAGRLMQEGKIAMEDGRTFGRANTATQCVDEVVRRHTQTAQGLGAAISQSLFLRGCIDTSAELPALCARNTGTGVLSNAQWLASLCRARGAPDRLCPTVLQPLGDACQRRQSVAS